MGRGRAPCCQKVGLNKGSWTLEEDRRLVAYINKNGHGNWRALPKQAGLLRCGKSCRLRWINYLRPDIKRGNFSKEEEDAIINLHELLGNKWSKIAGCLPGRTDNEIKNVWNTHLKKRLKPKTLTPPPSIAMIKPHEDSFSPSSSSATAMSLSHETSSSAAHGDLPSSVDDVEIPWDDMISTSSLEISMMECERWLADLEEELGLYGDGGGDRRDGGRRSGEELF